MMKTRLVWMLEDPYAVAITENKMAVAAEHLCLLIRPKSEPSIGTRTRNALSDTALDGNVRVQIISLEVIPSTGDEHKATVAPNSRR